MANSKDVFSSKSVAKVWHPKSKLCLPPILGVLAIVVIAVFMFYAIVGPMSWLLSYKPLTKLWAPLAGLGSYLQGVCSFLALTGIGYVAYQAHLMREQTTIAVYERMIQPMHEIDRVFLQYPCLLPYFYENRSVPKSRTERGRVRAVADMFLDFMDLYTVLHEATPRDAYVQDLFAKWKTYFVDVIRYSPALREQYRRSKRVGFYSHLQFLFDDAAKPEVPQSGSSESASQ